MGAFKFLVIDILQNIFFVFSKSVFCVCVDGPYWFPQYGKKYWSQWGPSTVWLPKFFQISSLVFNKRKKLV